jgi:transposase
MAQTNTRAGSLLVNVSIPRNLIERCVNRFKQLRRIATRYEKTARAYLSMLSIAAARLWAKTINTA